MKLKWEAVGWWEAGDIKGNGIPIQCSSLDVFSSLICQLPISVLKYCIQGPILPEQTHTPALLGSSWCSGKRGTRSLAGSKVLAQRWIQIIPFGSGRVGGCCWCRVRSSLSGSVSPAFGALIFLFGKIAD